MLVRSTYFISSTVTYSTYSSCSYYLRESKAGYLKHVDNFAHNFLYACGLMQQAYMLVLVPAGICSKPIRMACINFTITLRHWKSPESPLRNAREEMVDKNGFCFIPVCLIGGVSLHVERLQFHVDLSISASEIFLNQMLYFAISVIVLKFIHTSGLLTVVSSLWALLCRWKMKNN